MTFSSLTDAFDQPTNRLYEARDARLKSRRKILDLISGNVNDHGIAYPATALQRVVKEAMLKTGHYRPHPLGQARAREAVSRFYRGEGVSIPAPQLVLTPGTSISYWYCFKLLCDAGDEILCPAPSYPLFESIASLSAIKLVSYPLIEAERWCIDLHELENKITARTKAIVLISPHNPTGAVATSEEVRGIAEIAARRGLTIIHDEVFSSFLFSSSPGPINAPHDGSLTKTLGYDKKSSLPRPTDLGAPLVLTLNGFSKMFALAGMKIGWIGVTGESARVKRALKALEMISDTFLPTNEWAQAAVPGIFTEGASFLQDYRRSVHQRSKTAAELVKNCKGLSAISPEGGFFMTVRLGSGMEEEAFAVDLLNQEGVLIHPGFFYDMPGRHFVMTTVATPAELRTGFSKIRRLLS